VATALVTGASSGIGAAFARALAEEGNDLALVARDQARLESARLQLIERFDVKATVLSADLTTADGCDRVAERLADLREPIDILVNSAGEGTYRRFGRAELATEEHMLDLNVRAMLRLCHAAVRVMTDRGAGEIINVSSVAGFVPRGGNVTYSASKAWVTMFSEALAVQLRGSGVRVTAVCPGFTQTNFHQAAAVDMSSVSRWMWLDADEVVAAALADARRGKPVSIPSLRYKVMVTAARYAPRPLVREVMRRRRR
jgi:uncharacterized protein